VQNVTLNVVLVFSTTFFTTITLSTNRHHIEYYKSKAFKFGKLLTYCKNISQFLNSQFFPVHSITEFKQVIRVYNCMPFITMLAMNDTIPCVHIFYIINISNVIVQFIPQWCQVIVDADSASFPGFSLADEFLSLLVRYKSSNDWSLSDWF
jgi:hypothetical protein